MKTFRCTNCDHPVYFENTACATCGAALGYLPSSASMAAFEAAPKGVWKALGDKVQGAWRPCANYSSENVCNWMVPWDDPEALCSCCRQTEVIPTLDKPGNHIYWARLETAKRRLYYSLDTLGLARPGEADDVEHVLRFRFLEAVEGKEPALTGHDSGCITVNIAEANDAEREARRTAMGEPYRSLLGHFRHEIGHYYWDALIADGPWLAPFRKLFGDERTDYAKALEAHYKNGPQADWPEHYISAYATCHPWEDWAETWAHYLHVTDALETADHWGLHLDASDGPAGADPGASVKMSFRERLMFGWLPLARFLNSMSRSLGHGDSYPFVLPDPVRDKLAFVDSVVRSASGLDWREWPPAPHAKKAAVPA
jgi:hypothetical protein